MYKCASFPKWEKVQRREGKPGVGQIQSRLNTGMQVRFNHVKERSEVFRIQRVHSILAGSHLC